MNQRCCVSPGKICTAIDSAGLYLRGLAAAVALLSISACANLTDIEIDDEVTFTNLEVSAPFGENTETRVRFRATAVEGDLDQRLDQDDTVQIDGDAIDGPTVIDGSIDLRYLSLAFGGSEIAMGDPNGSTRASLYLGLAHTRFDLQVNDAGGSLKQDDDTFEVYAMFGLHHALTQNWELGLGWAASIGGDLSGINELDLNLDYRVARNFALSGGYRWFTYEYDGDGFDSDVEVDFHGPFLGARLLF